MKNELFIIKWFINSVFPGFEEVLAIDFLLHNELIREDFPTFDLPINANSGKFLSGETIQDEAGNTVRIATENTINNAYKEMASRGVSPHRVQFLDLFW